MTPRRLEVVDYAKPPDGPPPPAPLPVMLLCLPGIICWCTLLGMVFTPYLRSGSFNPLRLLGGAVWICWLAAIITAIASLIIYVRAKKPWYVWLNLAINGAGLLFTLAVVALIMAISYMPSRD